MVFMDWSTELKTDKYFIAAVAVNDQTDTNIDKTIAKARNTVKLTRLLCSENPGLFDAALEVVTREAERNNLGIFVDDPSEGLFSFVVSNGEVSRKRPHTLLILKAVE